VLGFALAGARVAVAEQSVAQDAPAPEPEQVAPTAPPEPKNESPPTASDQSGDRKKKKHGNTIREMARDGSLLPTVWSPRIGPQYVSAIALGGYSSAANQGGAFSAIVEGAILRRVAIRVGTEYSQESQPSFNAGVRINFIEQERFGINLGGMALYKNTGFSGNGELEMALLISRRWNDVSLVGNFVYGQGLVVGGAERDVEGKLALLYDVKQRIHLGLDNRARWNIGTYRAIATPITFDYIGGPLVGVDVGPVMFLAQTGAQVYVQDSQTHAGVIALAGVAASY
jgi:hypothetical protein